MAYLALTHGAKGLFWFTYKPVYGPLWDELGKLNREVAALAPLLLADGPWGAGRILGTPAVHYWSREFADRFLILAVNESSQPCSAVFAVSDKAETVEEIFEKRTLPLQQGVFIDAFSPLGTHAYTVRKRLP